MTVLRLATDGTLSLPKEMRDLLELKSGDEVEAKVEGNSIRLVSVTRKAEPQKGVDISPWIGVGKSFGSQQEIDDFIRSERDSWD